MIELLLGAVQSGVHVLGVPEQLVFPAASKAYSLSSSEPTYTTPLATAGEEETSPPVAAVQSGLHVLGEPEQLVLPAASNASRLPFSKEPT